MLNPSFRTTLIFLGVGFSCAVAGFLAGQRRPIVNPIQPHDRSAVRPPSPPSENLVAPQATSALAAASSREDLHSSLSAFRGQLNSPAAEETAVATLRALAVIDPKRALALAHETGTPLQHDLFTRATLEGWASIDSLAASQWTLAHVRPGERRLAVEAIVKGAITRADDAIRAVAYLAAHDPSHASDHHNTLVHALARAGHFTSASQFAAAAPAEFRAALLSTAFVQWAQYQPTAALEAANAFPDEKRRQDALEAVVAGWAGSNPAALVQYAQSLPVGEIRANALRDGLQQWVSLDPIAAATWMDRLDPSSDLDAGAAAIATSPALVAKQPDIATSWAESIVDPQLRTNTLLDLIRLWGATDVAGARRYASTTPVLQSEARQLALSALQSSP